MNGYLITLAIAIRPNLHEHPLSEAPLFRDISKLTFSPSIKSLTNRLSSIYATYRDIAILHWLSTTVEPSAGDTCQSSTFEQIHR